jgi:hypothetical protein
MEWLRNLIYPKPKRKVERQICNCASCVEERRILTGARRVEKFKEKLDKI